MVKWFGGVCDYNDEKTFARDSNHIYFSVYHIYTLSVCELTYLFNENHHQQSATARTSLTTLDLKSIFAHACIFFFEHVY
jgi:hypothetical protein